MINVERLHALLDRGADVATAAQRAHTDLIEAERALSQHQGDDASTALMVTRVERRREAHAVLRQRAAVWSPYCDALRRLAKAQGVQS